jgi:spore coat assembly protein
MVWMKQGDLVVRKSYGRDIVFRIEQIEHGIAILRGVEFRLLADSPVEDLEMADEAALHRELVPSLSKIYKVTRQIAQFTLDQKQKILRNLAQSAADTYTYFEVPGKVLHLDGDAAYLKKSMELYRRLQVPAQGYYVQESSMPELLYRILPKVKPDIVLITGHDGILKNRRDDQAYSLQSYKNSHNFVKAVQIARQYEKNRDALIIVAGACQSHFEALLQAGANFASSPGRILIHALDPVHIAAKISYTSIKETVNMHDIISHTISGIKGIGGIESRGSYRIGIPYFRK